MSLPRENPSDRRVQLGSSEKQARGHSSLPPALLPARQLEGDAGADASGLRAVRLALGSAAADRHGR